MHVLMSWLRHLTAPAWTTVWLTLTLEMRYFGKSHSGCIETRHVVIESLFNSSPPSAAFMRQWTRSAFVQIMTCHLIGAKPLSERMQPHCQLDPTEQAYVKFESKYKTFHSWKCIWRCRLRNGGHLCPGRGELKWYDMSNIVPTHGR